MCWPFLLVLVWVFFNASLVKAQVWTGNTSSDWNTASNWNSAQVPGASSSAIIDNPSGNQALISVANATADLVVVGNSSAGTASTPSLQISVKTLTSNSGIVGNSANATGYVNVGLGGLPTRGTWTLNHDLIVGNLGSGTLTIGVQGTVIVNGNLVLASQAGSNGTFNFGGQLKVGGIDGIQAGSGNYNIIWSFGQLDVIGHDFSTSLNINLTNNSSSGMRVSTDGFNATLSGNLGGSGSVTKLANGTLTLTGNNAYSGATNIFGGTLFFTSPNSLGTGPVTINNGTLKFGPGISIDLSNRGLSFNGSTAVVDTNGNDVTFANPIAGNTSDLGAGNFTKTGAGNLILANANTFAGSTSILSGNLVVADNRALQNSIVNITSLGGNISFGTGVTNAVFGGLSGDRDLNLVNADGAPVNLTFGNFLFETFSGNISGVNVTLTKVGTGTEVLTGNNTYSGPTQINAGSLSISTLNNLGTNQTIYFNGGAINFDSPVDVSTRITDFGPGGGGFDPVFQNVILTHPIGNGGAGSLTISGGGNGTIRLLADNNFSGDLILLGSTLIFSSLSQLGAGNTIDLFGGTLQYAPGSSVDISARTVNVGRYGWASTTTIDTNGNDVTFANSIGFAIGWNQDDEFAKGGAGNLTLAAANEMEAVVIVTGGNLVIANPNALQNSLLNYANQGGNVRFHGITTFHALGIGGNQELPLVNDDGEGVTLSLANSTSSFYGVLSGSGGVILSDSENLTLNANNTYTGNTVINSSTLVLWVNSGIGASSVIDLIGGTLDVRLVKFTVGASQQLQGTGTIVGNANVNGRLVPGDTGNLGVLNFSQNLSLSGNASASFQIGGASRGTQYGAINVGGNLTLGGTLQLNFTNGFEPPVGTTFNLFQVSGNVTGNFANVVLPADANFGWDTSQLATAGVIATQSLNYAQWAAAVGLTGNDALPTATPFTGPANVIRYALNLGTGPIAAGALAETVVNVGGANFLSIQYPARKYLTDYQLVPQYSTNMASWNNIDAGNISQLPDANTFTTRYQASVAMPANGPIFLRVLVMPTN